MKRPRRLHWINKKGGGYIAFNVIWAKQEVLDLMGEWDSAEVLLQHLADGAAESPTFLTRVHQALGDLLLRRGCYDRALELLEQARQRQLEDGDLHGLCLTLGIIGDVHSHRSEYAEAGRFFGEMLDLARSLDDRDRLARALNLIGNLRSDTGDFEAAGHHYQSWLEMARQDANPKDIAHATGSLGNVFFRQGKLDLALECYGSVLDASARMGDKGSMVSALGNRGIVLKNQRRFREASECFRQVLDISRSLGNKYSQSLALAQLADLAMQTGDLALSERHYLNRLMLVDELGDRRGQSVTWGNLGKVYLDMGELEKSEQAMSRSLEIGRGKGIDFFLCDYLAHYSELRLRQGRPEEAKALASEALEMARKANNLYITWYSRLALAKAWALDDPRGAEKLLGELADSAPCEHERSAVLELIRKTGSNNEET